MAKRNMKESMDNITNIKDSTAALSPEMQLAKEKAKDKDEEFEKIVLGKDVVLGLQNNLLLISQSGLLMSLYLISPFLLSLMNLLKNLSIGYQTVE